MEKEIEKIYEDENILLLNKPSGVVVNRSNTYSERTLQDLIEEKYVDVSKFDDEEFVSRSGLVHRLDKDTSGIILIAKNVDSFRFLQSQFKERNIYKEYVAVVHGKIEDEIVEIDASLARNPKNPLRIAVVSSGRNALTRVEREKVVEIENEIYTLVKVFPKTGRTHQIRVHLSAIGHPVVMDNIYCTKKLLEDGSVSFKRMMLHARFLGFMDPKSRKFKRFEAKLPVEFKI